MNKIPSIRSPFFSMHMQNAGSDSKIEGLALFTLGAAGLCLMQRMHKGTIAPSVAPSSVSQDSSSTEPLKDSWTTTMTPSAQEISKIPMFKGSPIECPLTKISIVPYETIKPYLEKSGTMVGWDQGEVIEGQPSTVLYSKEFGPCIAVAIRGTSSEGKVTLGLHHIFGNSLAAKKTIEEVMNRVKKGNIDIFISGGDPFNRNSTENRRHLNDAIKKLQSTKSGQYSIAVKDDTFGLHGGHHYTLVTSKAYVSIGQPGVSWVGFVNNNPVQCMNIRVPEGVTLQGNEQLYLDKP